MKKLLYILLFIYSPFYLLGQDTITKPTIDTTAILWTIVPGTFHISSMISYTIDHRPTKDDSAYFNKNSGLINQKPTKKNYINFYSLATSLWELNKLNDAEKLFSQIVESNREFYSSNYYHSSDIPGDNTKNKYGYGSCTLNYKNYACRYLTKIYIEEKKFDLALKYLKEADLKYPNSFSCGTGQNIYRNELSQLYGLCYEGLGQVDSIINLFLPKYDNWENGILIKALKKKYTKGQISNYLEIAVNSITCVADTFQSTYSTIENYGEKNEKSTETKYTSGKGTINLFDKVIALYSGLLKEGEVASRDQFVKEFEQTAFYQELIKDE